MRHGISTLTVVTLFAVCPTFTVTACALLSKSEFAEIRYFSPERATPRTSSAGPAVAPASGAAKKPVRLRLGRVSSGRNLRERIAYRGAAYELGYYRDLRWTERPEAYVERALGRSLFEVHGLRRVLSGTAPTLEVEVIAFDELRLPKIRAARIQLKLMLYDDTGAVLDDTLTVDRPVAGETPEIEDVVAAMANALDAAADQTTLRVQMALAASRSSSPPGSTP